MQLTKRACRHLFLFLTLVATCILSASPLSQDMPQTVFSTLYGGSGTDDCDAVAVDPNGNIFLGCHLNSPDLPGSKQYGYSLNVGMDAFVIKLNSGDHSVGYITHWGGKAWDAIQGIVADANGNSYAVGVTYSDDFPVSASAAQPAFGGESDIFVAKLSSSGQVVWTTFLGGNGDEDSSDIVLDAQGQLHIVGRTSSTNLPTNKNSYQNKLAGATDAFVATFDTDGKLHYVTYLGGNGEDVGAGLAIDSEGKRFISGYSTSADFPVVKPLNSKLSGNEDAFIAVLDSQSNTLEFSTYLGGSGIDRAVGIGISDSQHIVVGGDTMSPDLPVTQSGSSFSGGRNDVFIARINIENPRLEQLSYFGGSGSDRLLRLALNDSGKVILVGDTTSTDFIATHDFRVDVNTEGDGYIAIVDTKSLSSLETIVNGGTAIDVFEGLAIGPDGTLIVTGASNSSDFPKVSPVQTEFMGGRFDILIAKFQLGLSP